MPEIVTSEIFYQEIAKAVFENLKTILLQKQRNHCIRVDFLPKDVMMLTCEKLNLDADLNKNEVEAFVLVESISKPFEVDSGKLIEFRNRKDFGVLVIFIQQGFRGAAEDSYDIHTFEKYDLAGVLAQHRKSLIESFTDVEQ